MVAAAHLDNLLFLLFVVIAIFFQILTRAATKSRRRPGDTSRRPTSPSQMSRPLSRKPDETDEERVRKFLEALGQPTTSKPPAPVAPRPTYQRPTVLPHVPPLPSPLPPLTTRPPNLPREARTIRSKVSDAPAFEVEQGPPPPLEPISEAQVRAAFQPTSPQASSRPREIATLLRSTSGLRDAIILREIFGPPRSLQPLDLVGTV